MPWELHVQSDCWETVCWKRDSFQTPIINQCTYFSQTTVVAVPKTRNARFNLTGGHNGDCICFTCESDYVALARDRREQSTPLDREVMCGLQCDCNETMQPGCCKIPDYSYNSHCCLIDGHSTIGAPSVLSKYASRVEHTTSRNTSTDWLLPVNFHVDLARHWLHAHLWHFTRRHTKPQWLRAIQGTLRWNPTHGQRRLNE